MDAAYILSSIFKNHAYGLSERFHRSRGTLGVDKNDARKAEAFRTLHRILREVDFDPRGSTIAELGVGRSTDILIAFALAGAGRATGLDVKRWLLDEPVTAAKLSTVSKILRDQPSVWFDAELGATPDEDLERVANAVGYSLYEGMRMPFDDESLDLIYSKSVLEHVAKDAVYALAADQYRSLKPGGLVCHIVDLRDHCHIDGDERQVGDWLDMLRYSDRLHHLMTSQRPASVNRLRSRSWRKVFEDTGFELVGFHEIRRDLHPDFESSKVHPDVFDPQEDYSIAWLEILGRKV